MTTRDTKNTEALRATLERRYEECQDMARAQRAEGLTALAESEERAAARILEQLAELG